MRVNEEEIVISTITASEEEPSDPSPADGWFDPSAGVLWVFGEVDGVLDWQPIPPIAVTDEAASFDETDISVSGTYTVIENGGVQLGEKVELGPSGSSGGGSSCTENDWYGLRFTANKTFTSPYVNIYNLHPWDGIRLLDGGGGVVVEETNIESAGSYIFEDVTLQSGEEYIIELRADYGYLGETAFSDTTGEYAEILSSTANGSNTSEFGDYPYITGLGTLLPALSDAATISFEQPSDVESWELVSFQASSNGGSVTVNVLDGDGNVLFANIDRNTNVSTVSPETNLQLQAELERSDGSANPRLEYASRRYTR
jgi:hypothetical protein